MSFPLPDEALKSGSFKAPRSKVCDVCRTRKVKCRGSGGIDPRCEGCRLQDIACMYEYKMKRPGPTRGSRYRNHRSITQPTFTRRTKTSEMPISLNFDDIQETAAVYTPSRRTNPIASVDEFLPNSILNERAGKTSAPDLIGAVDVMLQVDNAIPPVPPSAKSHTSGVEIGRSPLDDLVSRVILDMVVGLFYDYLYCLVPFPHRTSLLRDLQARREMGSDEAEWTAMVVALLGFTLVQVPHQLVSMPIDEIRRLVRTSLRHTQRHIASDFADFSVNRIFTLYCGSCMAFILGSQAMSRMYHGAMVSLTLQKELDRENTYAKMDPLQREMSRRIWWLVYSADRSGATCEGSKALLSEDFASQVAYPDPRSGHYIENDMSNPLESDQESVLSAFYYNAILWRLGGRLIVIREKAALAVPCGSELLNRILEVEEILEELNECFLGCPQHLLMDFSSKTVFDSVQSRPASMSLSKLRSLKDHSLLGVVVQKANLYITQQVLKLVAAQCRESLQRIRLRERESKGVRFLRQQASLRHERESVLSTMLCIIHQLPLELIAVNTIAGLTKVKYVAATLLSDFDEGVHLEEQELAHTLNLLHEYTEFMSKWEAVTSLHISLGKTSASLENHYRS